MVRRVWCVRGLENCRDRSAGATRFERARAGRAATCLAGAAGGGNLVWRFRWIAGSLRSPRSASARASHHIDRVTIIWGVRMPPERAPGVAGFAQSNLLEAPKALPKRQRSYPHGREEGESGIK